MQAQGKNALVYAKSFLKWILLATVVGLFGGFVGSLFHLCVDFVTELRVETGWLIYLLPIGGVFIAALYALSKNKGNIDTNRVLEAVRTDRSVPFIMAPLIFISTVITHLLGGSAGREGAALQLGGSIGYRVGKTFRLGEGDMHILVMSGMSAVFSALFGTPITAAVFALEVVRVGTFRYAALVPSTLSALVAVSVAERFGIAPVHFAGIAFPSLSVLGLLQAAGLALCCALVGILFCKAIHTAEHFSEKFLPNKYIRGFLGGALLVLLTLLVGTRDYNGAGMDVISRAIGGEAAPEAFLLKIVFTAITIAAGFRGGEIVPTFFIGSTFGCAAGALLGMDPALGAAIGFVALFCSVVNCPIASTFLAVEVFGAEGLPVFALVCAVSYMMSGLGGLYKTQQILYSKTDESELEILQK